MLAERRQRSLVRAQRSDVGGLAARLTPLLAQHRMLIIRRLQAA